MIADDLTGALDAAAPFAGVGRTTFIAVAPAHIDEALSHAPDVLAVSTNTRERPECEAVAQMLAVALRLGSAEVIFKKVDSRLKGHVRAELMALADLRGAASVLLCPAIPEFGRIVRDGAISGFGVDAPISCAAVIDGAEPPIAIADASTEAELDAILADALAGNRLLAGARGLAGALARRGATGGGATSGGAQDGRTRLELPAAIGVGSRDPITLEQIDRLRSARPGLPVVFAPNGVASGPSPDAPLVVLQVRQGAQEATGADVEAAFVDSFAPRFTEGRRTLVLTGGATAATVLERLGVGVLQLMWEAAPGIPVSRVIGVAGGLQVVTKSGGFGTPQALVDLVDLIGGPA